MNQLNRPTGISILAVLYILGGAFLGLTSISSFEQIIKDFNAWSLLGVIAVYFISGLIVASGIGMWKGLKWGWYLGSFYQIFEIFTNANSMIVMPPITNSLLSEEIIDISFYGKHGIGVVIHLFLYLYFYKANVREFFHLSLQNRWKLFGVRLGICIALAVVIALIIMNTG